MAGAGSYVVQFLIVAGFFAWLYWMRKNNPGWKPAFLRAEEKAPKAVPIKGDDRVTVNVQVNTGERR